MSTSTQTAPVTTPGQSSRTSVEGQFALMDGDGTSFNTEYLALQTGWEIATTFIFDKYKVNLTDIIDFERFSELYRGKPFALFVGREINPLLKENFKVEIQADDLTLLGEIEDRIMVAKFKEQTERIPHIEETLRSLEALNLIPALVTNSTVPRMNACIEGTGLEQVFGDFRFSARDPKYGPIEAKPEGDIYLIAMETLGVDPETSLVVEDSPTGVKAARDAGLRNRVGFVPPNVLEKGIEAEEWHVDSLKAAGATHIVVKLPQVIAIAESLLGNS